MIDWIKALVARAIRRRRLVAQLALAETVMREDRDVLRRLAQSGTP